MHQGQRFDQVDIQISSAAMVREICATSMVCVRRVRKWSESRRVKTCVLFSSRRKARAWITRSRSRWNGLR